MPFSSFIFRKTGFFAGMAFSLFLLSGCNAGVRGEQAERAPHSLESFVAESPGTVEEERLLVNSSNPGESPESSGDLSSGAEGGSSISFISPHGATLGERIMTPVGFERTAVEEGSFGRFVRDFPMEPDGSPILLYDGSRKSRQDVGIATFSLPVISSADLQQCADSVMRMYAEYFWQSAQYDKIRFHFVNGFLFDYPTYRAGGRVKFNDNVTEWQTHAAYDDSYEAFANYLYIAFAYSSTLSMEGESVPAGLNDVRIGDIFLKSGSPGHVVMVVDVCVNQDGEKAFLLAQSYMPAQQFYVLKNPAHESDPWYYCNEIAFPLSTPEYTFQEGSFRRLIYLD